MNVHLVFARPRTNPWQLELLAIFEDFACARAFIDRARAPQRDCLEVHTWPLNEPSADPCWTGEADTPLWEQARATRLEAIAIGSIMKARGLPEYFIAQVVDWAVAFEGTVELLRTWRDEPDISERNAIIANLQELISEYGFSRP